MKRRPLLAVVSTSVLLLTSGLAAAYQFSPTGVQQFFRIQQ